LEQVADLWHHEAKFQPKMSKEDRDRLYSGWLEAVNKVLGK